MVIMNKTIITYVIFVMGCIFGGGSVIRLYGNTCGLSLFDPSGWFTSTVLMGSPWCRGLNWVGFIVSSVVENIWYHLIASSVGIIYSFSGMNTKSVGRPDISSPGCGPSRPDLNTHGVEVKTK